MPNPNCFVEFLPTGYKRFSNMTPELAAVAPIFGLTPESGGWLNAFRFRAGEEVSFTHNDETMTGRIVVVSHTEKPDGKPGVTCDGRPECRLTITVPGRAEPVDAFGFQVVAAVAAEAADHGFPK